MNNPEFPFVHHSTMLADKIRLKKYQEALTKVIHKNDIIVDAGAGTGILAHYASEEGAKKVIAIEYFKSTCEVAEEILQQSDIQNIFFINARTYDVSLECEPTILITETIGPIGPEENIVEICYDFCSRHPSIKTVIPIELSLFAQPFYSKKIERRFESMLANFSDGCKTFKVSDLLASKFDKLYCSNLIQGYLDDVQTLDDLPIPIASYHLGYDKKSDFDVQFDFAKYREANGMYLFFKAQLCSGTELTNHFSDRQTHWVPYYFKKPADYNVASLVYNSKTKKCSIEWD